MLAGVCIASKRRGGWLVAERIPTPAPAAKARTRFGDGRVCNGCGQVGAWTFEPDHIPKCSACGRPPFLRLVKESRHG